MLNKTLSITYYSSCAYLSITGGLSQYVSRRELSYFTRTYPPFQTEFELTTDVILLILVANGWFVLIIIIINVTD